MNDQQRKRFAPLQKHEDKQRSFWFLLGALPILALWYWSLKPEPIQQQPESGLYVEYSQTCSEDECWVDVTLTRK